jgi:cell division protease FtsH
MIAEYGMSEQFGPVALPTMRTRFLNSEAVERADMVSEETARAIDREVKQLMTEAHERAIQILRQHRSTLDAVVQLLLAREVVDGSDVRRLLDAEAAQPSLRASA